MELLSDTELFRDLYNSLLTRMVEKADTVLYPC